MKNATSAAAAAAILAATATAAEAQTKAPLVFYWTQVEKLEYRLGDDDTFAWDGDFVVGTDDLRLVLRSQAEYLVDAGQFERLENQARLQTPISDFFDAAAGIRVDTPKGPDRVYGVLGLHGLAPQWFEIDADFFVGGEGDASFRLDADYEALITNRVILTPTLEVDLPLTDDEDIGLAAFGPKLEASLRLSYDLVDRAVAPYVGVYYERSFGGTADLAREEGESVDAAFLLGGVRLRF